MKSLDLSSCQCNIKVALTTNPSNITTDLDSITPNVYFRPILITLLVPVLIIVVAMILIPALAYWCSS